MPDRLTTFPVVTTKLELSRQSFLSLNLKIEKNGDLFFLVAKIQFKKNLTNICQT